MYRLCAYLGFLILIIARWTESMFLPRCSYFYSNPILANAQGFLPSQSSLLPDAWPPGPGHRLIPQSPDRELVQILSQIDSKRIEAIIEKLVSFGTRSTLSNQTDPVRGIGAARDWIASEMRKFAATSGGRMAVSVPSYVQEPTTRVPSETVISNVLATLHGSEGSNRVYVVSGHYDSRVTDVLNFIDDAPGANDDASGKIFSQLISCAADHHAFRRRCIHGIGPCNGYSQTRGHNHICLRSW